jgi:peptide/nickel transport system ATP-binding protein
VSDTILDVGGLEIVLAGTTQTTPLVQDVSFSIAAGAAFGLVGESGCGKSITALAVMGLLRAPLQRRAGSIALAGRDIAGATETDLRSVRGRDVAMIFQEPMTALNPLQPVGRQIAEMFVLHEAATWREAEARAVEALRQVRVPAPERRAKDYPHQLSGGMRQRVMIAIALACRPKLLVADEPTTALDVTVQAEIVELMAELCAARGTAILMISHDLGLVARMCREIAVMYAGRIVEQAAADDLLSRARHPYTQGLIGALPRLGARAAAGRRKLAEIPGMVPAPTDALAGCRFHPRCVRATAPCHTAQPATRVRPGGGVVRCHHDG